MRDEKGPASEGLDPRLEAGLAAACAILLVAGYAAGRWASTPLVATALHLTALAVGSLVPLRDTLPALRRRRVDVELLMLLAAFGAAYLDQPGEGAMLMFLFSGATALKHYTSRRTRQSIEALKSHLEDEAVLLLPDGHERVVPVEQLQVGDQLLLRPGARVPVDGLVIDGESSVDEAALTGESMPVAKSPGEAVLAGSMNLSDGALTVEVTRPASDSTLARMIRLVEQAQRNRARAQVFTDWFGERYTKVVILGCLAAFAVPVWGFGVPWQAAVYRAMTLLVVASPCALVLATPAAILAAIATAARHGILVKGGASLEAIARSKVVVFDKTGTLTLGEPRLERVLALAGVAECEVLRLAASAEQRSEHPLATAIVAAARSADITLAEPEAFRAVTGQGVIAAVGGESILVGSPRLFEQQGVPVPECPEPECPDKHHDGCRALRVSRAGEPLGLLDLEDTIRPAAAETVAKLKASGIDRVAMLTGDLRTVAKRVAAATGVDEVHAELLPDQKLERLEELRAEHGSIIMVGDGVNDAPALAAADVGVAMGGIGSDVALETADVVLTSDDLSRLPLLLDLSRRTTRIVRQNLAFAIAVIVVMVTLTLTTGSFVRLPTAVFAHEGGTVLVMLNGLRLLRS